MGCDRIIVLDKDRRVGFGPWDELMAGNDAFQKIARLRDNEQERPYDPKPAVAWSALGVEEEDDCYR